MSSLDDSILTERQLKYVIFNTIFCSVLIIMAKNVMELMSLSLRPHFVHIIRKVRKKIKKKT